MTILLRRNVAFIIHHHNKQNTKLCNTVRRRFQSNWTIAALRASEYISTANSVLFVTGAGISVESGLPTYRGVAALYNEGRTPEGFSIEECLSSSMYQYRPSLTWKYLLQIEQSCRGAQPNRAHQLVAATERNTSKVTVITQNIDGFHTRAGSTDVINLHGELYKLLCTSCGHEQRVESYADLEEEGVFPPKCPKCHENTVRPGVVLFDEFLGEETIQKYEDRMGGEFTNLMYAWQIPSLMPHAYDVSVCIGTSAMFPYVNAAALSGKKTIEINPTRTDLSHLVDAHVAAGATDAMEFIFEKLGWED